MHLIALQGAFLFLITAGLIECITTTKSARFVYNSDVSLTCTSTESSMFYETTLAGVTKALNTDSDSNKYTFAANTLTIKTLKKDQIQSSYRCNSTTDSTIFVSEVVPYLYKIDTQIITITEENSVELSCKLLVGTENNQNITWSWLIGGNIIALTSEIVVTSNDTYSKVLFKNASISDGAKYTCEATNQFGSFTREIELRVKSKLAPLWPFIGIVGEVILLVLSIYFLETRPNAAKKKKEKVAQENDIAT